MFQSAAETSLSAYDSRRAARADAPKRPRRNRRGLAALPLGSCSLPVKRGEVARGWWIRSRMKKQILLSAGSRSQWARSFGREGLPAEKSW